MHRLLQYWLLVVSTSALAFLPVRVLGTEARPAIVMPFTLAKNGAPLVRIGLERHLDDLREDHHIPADFLFDTGCSICLLTETPTAKLQLPRKPGIGDDGKPVEIGGRTRDLVFVPNLFLGKRS